MSSHRSTPNDHTADAGQPSRRAETSAPVPAIFQSPRTVYHADTCEPLKAAAATGEVRLAAFGRGGYPGSRLPSEVLPGVPSLGFWDAPRNQKWGLA